MNLKIGNWMEPKTRPSVMVEIGSESLWRLGPERVCSLAFDLIEANGGIVKEPKVSRADLCVDVQFDEKLWSPELADFMVTRAKKRSIHFGMKGMETFTVGKNVLMARLYDKPLEIAEKSKKTWMYEIWGIERGKVEGKTIRVEFQLRREILKELGVGKLHDFLKDSDRVWAYCTKKWLKFQDKPGSHHTQRKTLDWWEIVQGAYLGVQDAQPCIRQKAIQEDLGKMRSQVVGFASSITALTLDQYEFEIKDKINFNDCISAVIQAYQDDGHGIAEFNELVLKKRAKYRRRSA
jgi:hypothetical protein